jgi:hypothetical protein
MPGAEIGTANRKRPGGGESWRGRTENKSADTGDRAGSGAADYRPPSYSLSEGVRGRHWFPRLHQRSRMLLSDGTEIESDSEANRSTK